MCQGSRTKTTAISSEGVAGAYPADRCPPGTVPALPGASGAGAGRTGLTRPCRRRLPPPPVPPVSATTGSLSRLNRSRAVPFTVTGHGCCCRGGSSRRASSRAEAVFSGAERPTIRSSPSRARPATTSAGPVIGPMTAPQTTSTVSRCLSFSHELAPRGVRLVAVFDDEAFEPGVGQLFEPPGRLVRIGAGGGERARCAHHPAQIPQPPERADPGGPDGPGREAILSKTSLEGTGFGRVRS